MDDDGHIQRMLDTVMENLDQHHVRCAQFKDYPAIMFRCHSKAIHTCIVEVRSDRPLLLCLLSVSCRVPPEKRPAAAELVTRINYGLQLGGFEMDFSDGEIRYRTSLDVSGGELASEMVESVISATIGTVDRYYPAIMSFLWSDMDPEDAVAMIEAPPAEPDARQGP
jgi:hypothetical protein